MSNREIAADIIGRMPEDASLYDMARELEFAAAVREGLAELDRGEGISLNEAERRLAFTKGVQEGLADVERGNLISLEQVERELPKWIEE
jgi:predicted transcriptional regulator